MNNLNFVYITTYFLHHLQCRTSLTLLQIYSTKSILNLHHSESNWTTSLWIHSPRSSMPTDFHELGGGRESAPSKICRNIKILFIYMIHREIASESDSQNLQKYVDFPQTCRGRESALQNLQKYKKNSRYMVYKQNALENAPQNL